MSWTQLRTCKACETAKPITAFELVRNKGQRPCRRWTCIECLLPDRAAWLRARRARPPFFGHKMNGCAVPAHTAAEKAGEA